MRNSIRILCSCGLLILCLVSFSKDSKHSDQVDTFIIKKKKKKISKSKLQEKVCSSFVSQMSDMPDVHKKIADLQQLLLEQTGKYLENSKESLLVKANKEKLKALLQKAEDFEAKITEFCTECDNYVNYLRGLR